MMWLQNKPNHEHLSKWLHGNFYCSWLFNPTLKMWWLSSLKPVDSLYRLNWRKFQKLYEVKRVRLLYGVWYQACDSLHGNPTTNSKDICFVKTNIRSDHISIPLENESLGFLCLCGCQSMFVLFASFEWVCSFSKYEK